MTEEFDQVVKVLYDYKYSDEAGEIQIRNGDIYRLVEKTNNEWWQVYDPSDADGESFFVPAQYVEIVHEESPWKALSDLDKALTFGDERSASPKPDYNDDPSDLYSTAASATSGRPIIPNTDDAYININSGGVGDQGDRDGEYINLDSYRTAAGIPSLVSIRLKHGLIYALKKTRRVECKYLHSSVIIWVDHCIIVLENYWSHGMLNYWNKVAPHFSVYQSNLSI